MALSIVFHDFIMKEVHTGHHISSILRRFISYVIFGNFLYHVLSNSTVTLREKLIIHFPESPMTKIEEVLVQDHAAGEETGLMQMFLDVQSIRRVVLRKQERR